MQLTPREQQVLRLIRQHRDQEGCLPSARTISAKLGFRSSRSSQNYIESLKQKGALRHRTPETASYTLAEDDSEDSLSCERIPLVGAIAAGAPLLDVADSDHDRTINIPTGFFGGTEPLFAVQVCGDSMSGDAICDGDIAIIKRQHHYEKGSIMAIRIGADEFALKRLAFEGSMVKLLSSNPDYPIVYFCAEHINIAGKFVGLLRKL